MFFCFKQKTAYEMRISDWSSDVCSSDLVTNLSGATQQVTVNLRALDPLAIADGTRTLTLKDRQRTTLRFTATATGSYGLGQLRLQIDGQGGAKPVHIVRESVDRKSTRLNSSH